MFDIKKIDFVVAVPGENGAGKFVEVSQPLRIDIPGAFEGVYFWSTNTIPLLPSQFGDVPRELVPPPAGGTVFGVLCFPAKSSGRLDVAKMKNGTDQHDDGSSFTRDDPGMHKTSTIDYEFVISGRIDIVLAGGARRTLRPGSMQMMGGVMHAWENHYDEPCLIAVVVVGGTAS